MTARCFTTRSQSELFSVFSELVVIAGFKMSLHGQTSLWLWDKGIIMPGMFLNVYFQHNLAFDNRQQKPSY